jgi:hypothetical protein
MGLFPEDTLSQDAWRAAALEFGSLPPWLGGTAREVRGGGWRAAETPPRLPKPGPLQEPARSAAGTPPPPISPPPTRHPPPTAPAPQLALMPVVGAHRGTYFSYTSCWAWAQAAWASTAAPLLGALPGGDSDGAAAPASTHADGGDGGAVEETRARGVLRGLMSLSARLTDDELLAALHAAARPGAGAPQQEDAPLQWAPPLPEDLAEWFDFGD